MDPIGFDVVPHLVPTDRNLPFPHPSTVRIGVAQNRQGTLDPHPLRFHFVAPVAGLLDVARFHHDLRRRTADLSLVSSSLHLLLLLLEAAAHSS